MADRRMRQGGAEDFVRSRQYEYGQNSNLVLEADRETRRRNDEGTGEVESLVDEFVDKFVEEFVEELVDEFVHEIIDKIFRAIYFLRQYFSFDLL